MSSEWSWDWEWDGPEDNGPTPFNPIVVGTAAAEHDESPSAQRRSALSVALAVVRSENAGDLPEAVDVSTGSASTGGWTPPMWNPPKDPGPIWAPTVWPPPTGSLPVGDAISISIGGASSKRRLKSLNSGRRNAGKRDQRHSEH
jgi:hypothetical protein